MDDDFGEFDPIEMFLYEVAHRDNRPRNLKLRRELLNESENRIKINDKYSAQYFNRYIDGLKALRNNSKALLTARDLLEFQIEMDCKYRNIICTTQSILYPSNDNSTFKIVTDTKNPLRNRMLTVKEVSKVFLDKEEAVYDGYHIESSSMYDMLKSDNKSIYELDYEHLSVDERMKIPKFLSNPLLRVLFEDDTDLMRKYYNKMKCKKGLRIRTENLGIKSSHSVWTPIYISFNQNGLRIEADSPMYSFNSCFIVRN